MRSSKIIYYLIRFAETSLIKIVVILTLAIAPSYRAYADECSDVNDNLKILVERKKDKLVELLKLYDNRSKLINNDGILFSLIQGKFINEKNQEIEMISNSIHDVDQSINTYLQLYSLVCRPNYNHN